MPKKKGIIYWLLILLTISSLVYSTTFQQYKFFKLENNIGLKDAKSYIEMSRNNYKTADQIHRYRFIIPKAVSLLRENNIISNLSKFNRGKESNEDKVTIFLFYIVNLIFTISSAFILFLFLEKVGLKSIGAAIGTVIYITSRVTIISTGAPLVDSAQFFAIFLTVYLSYCKKLQPLVLLNPILVLTKETFFPLIFLPYFKKSFRNYKYLLSTLVSIISVVFSRKIINNLAYLNSIDENNKESLLNTISNNHLNSIFNHFKFIFSPNGFHDFIFSPYAFFLPMGLMGYFLNKKLKVIKIPSFYFLLIPYSLFLSLISGNLGRMFMISSPVIIPYSAFYVLNLLEISPKKTK